ncbi:MAG: TonB-dependent receptor [Candidatus Omnitrophica bacterium]|nr:TonB-dependent receptor [Candidatus Omnitrophota bacterium]MDD5077640.1 TonB-dependent receptor [Candidatus Omnitrophota bacterium]
MKRKFLIYTLMAVLFTAGQARADEAATGVVDESKSAVNIEEQSAEGAGTGTQYDLGNVIVSATKTETYQAEIGSSTTVITAEDIARTGKRTVEEVLRDVPGLTVMQTGALGGGVSVFIRGANSGQTLVMIDGVEVNDPINASRTFDFSNLLTDNIERIEIVRGPQSTLYGSDAMAGVINIITKKGTAKPEIEGSFEGGSHNTFTENLALRGITAQDKLNYSFSATRLDSKGISKAYNGSEKDPYHNTSLSSKVGYKVLDNAELSAVVNYTDAVTGLDNGANNDVSNYTSWSRDLTSKVAFDQAINSYWTHILSFSYHDIRRKDRRDWNADDDNIMADWYKGNNKKVEWQHNISPVKWNMITAGFEYEKETGSSSYSLVPDPYGSSDHQDRKSVDNYGYYLQDQLKVWDRLFITPGLRVDDHEMFGTETTYKVSTAYLIPETGTRLKGNWGTGFKAPTLYQLYSIYGDTNLKPEENRSYDFGFEQSFLQDKLSFDLTYFHNNFKNLIEWASIGTFPYGEYRNVAKAVTKGFEVGAKIKPLDNLTFSANYTYTDSEDESTGLELVRRPKNQANFNINWGFLPKANLDFGMNYMGSRRDSDYNSVKDKPYTIFRLAASYDITENLKIFGRIENLFDRKYQEVYGYETLGRSFYAGLKAKF